MSNTPAPIAIFLVKVNSIDAVCNVPETKNVNNDSATKHKAISQVKIWVYKLFNLLDFTTLNILPNMKNKIALPNKHIDIRNTYCVLTNVSIYSPTKVV